MRSRARALRRLAVAASAGRLASRALKVIAGPRRFAAAAVGLLVVVGLLQSKRNAP